ncbi:DUF4351 domain-containing protein [Nostoc sp. XA010]|uniref:DUF4351 domain-containing protein n=1 Tax=Nostoc sp. XA010 TaxID=2780407 RepID=UPI001E28D9D4|nr:DUF4351 domain-containing protein [Nostoc sp. XA010]MCC5656151.1 DUF4351 domain-containing protein [Nostoc sp. XA010]
MAVLPESPWYQEIEQRGIQQRALRQLIRVLQQRFGEIPHEVEVRLEGENVEELETLMDSAVSGAYRRYRCEFFRRICSNFVYINSFISQISFNYSRIISNNCWFTQCNQLPKI